MRPHHRPARPRDSGIIPEKSIIVGNTVLYWRDPAAEGLFPRHRGRALRGAQLRRHRRGGRHRRPRLRYMTGGIVGVRRSARPAAASRPACRSGIPLCARRRTAPSKSAATSRLWSNSSRSRPRKISQKEHGHVNDPPPPRPCRHHGRHDELRCRAPAYPDYAARPFTGSKRAAQILADWKSYLPKFRKVMPVEYRRALAELKAAEAAEANKPQLARVEIDG